MKIKIVANATQKPAIYVMDGEEERLLSGVVSAQVNLDMNGTTATLKLVNVDVDIHTDDPIIIGPTNENSIDSSPA